MTGTVCCDVTSFEMSNSGAIWGGVWISGKEQDFPEHGWNDLVVAFLVELHRAVDQIRRAGGHVRVRFFDGPYWLDLKAEQGGLLSIEAAGEKAGVGFNNTLDFRDFEHHLIDETILVLRECKIRGWSEQSDVQLLASHIPNVHWH